MQAMSPIPLVIVSFSDQTSKPTSTSTAAASRLMTRYPMWIGQPTRYRYTLETSSPTRQRPITGAIQVQSPQARRRFPSLRRRTYRSAVATVDTA